MRSKGRGSLWALLSCLAFEFLAGCTALRADLPDAQSPAEVIDDAKDTATSSALDSSGERIASGSEEQDASAGISDMGSTNNPSPPDTSIREVGSIDVIGGVPDSGLVSDVLTGACSNACVVGALECVGVATRTCIRLANGCTAWGTETACTVENGTALCEQGRCAVAACTVGYNRCGSSCVRPDDINACGSVCSKCPAIENGSVVCAAGSCGARCNPGNGKCVLGAVCDRRSWTFETGTEEGANAINEAGDTGALTTASRSGKWAISVSTSGSGITSAHYAFKSCANNGGLLVSGQVLSAWVYAEVETLSSCSFRYGLNGDFVALPSSTVAGRQWVRVSTPALDGRLNVISLACTSNGSGPVRWIVDDVSIE